MENWPNDLLEITNEIIWHQWSAMGAYLSVEPTRRSIIDPEALLVSTCAFGRYDPRIFDEAMDWTIANHRLLKPWRLKKVAREFGGNTQRTLGAALDYIAEGSGQNLFPGVREEASKALREEGTEALFWREKRMYESGDRQADPVFMKWKLLRGQPRIRNHSKAPDMENPANLMIRLREYYGPGVKADVMTYLLAGGGGGGSSREIANKITYAQGGVYKVLEGFVNAGIAYKQGGPGKARYWVDREPVARSLGLKGKRPVFIAWADAFLAIHLVFEDRRTHEEEYESDFLSAERMRDLTVRVVPLIGNAGEPLSQIKPPDIRRQQGSEHQNNLVTFLLAALKHLKVLTVW